MSYQLGIWADKTLPGREYQPGGCDCLCQAHVSLVLSTSKSDLENKPQARRRGCRQDEAPKECEGVRRTRIWCDRLSDAKGPCIRAPVRTAQMGW
jgi:hypothetical protein